MSFNNMKKIREIYGATQDEIAKIAGVNRSTVSQWETGALKASDVKLEKLSIFYGLGPESFYELAEIDDERKEMLLNMAKRAKEIQEKSERERNKAEELAAIFENTSFELARKRFVFSMKVLLSTAEQGKLEDLILAYQVNQKMARRLEAIIQIRQEEEEANNENTLFDLLDSILDDDM